MRPPSILADEAARPDGVMAGLNLTCTKDVILTGESWVAGVRCFSVQYVSEAAWASVKRATAAC